MTLHPYPGTTNQREGRSRRPAWLVLSDFQTHHRFLRLVRRKRCLHSCVWRLLDSALPSLSIQLNPYGSYNSVPGFCVGEYIKPEYMGTCSAIWTCSVLGAAGNGHHTSKNGVFFPPLTSPGAAFESHVLQWGLKNENITFGNILHKQRDCNQCQFLHKREFLTAFNFVRYQEISQILHSGITSVKVDYQSNSLNQQV